MENIEMTRNGDTLLIKVDLAKRIGPSGSGKTTIVATSSGNVSVPGTDVKLGLNVYVPNRA